MCSFTSARTASPYGPWPVSYLTSNDFSGPGQHSVLAWRLRPVTSSLTDFEVHLLRNVQVKLKISTQKYVEKFTRLGASAKPL